jgi:glycosyltransferase involved in cell wall biosynthesis
MNVVALMTVRNEALYLERCLRHLHENDVKVCLIDNQSGDSSLDIARSFKCKNVIHIESLPFSGCFALEQILCKEQEMASMIRADWFIHHDADEIRQSPDPEITLKQALFQADQKGYNAVNFDEFVFLPCKEDQKGYEGRDYVRTMQYYYYFAPGRPHRINAWKNTGQAVDLVSSGGHRVQFHGMRIYPENFILRHYIGLSREHLIKKYAKRKYSAEEIKKRGWHKKRAAFTPERLALPSRHELKKICVSGSWDRTDPWTKHYFLG